jgi:hypothetical protein
MKRKKQPRTLIDIFKNCKGYHGFNHLGCNVVIHYENSEMTKVEVNGVTFVKEGAQRKPAEDMSDWRNWREGDLVECVNDDHVAELCCGDVLSLLGVYKESELIQVKLSSSSYHMYDPARFRWHSRPTKEQP